MKTILLAKGHVAFVDDADFEQVSKFKWHAKKTKTTYYATTHDPKNPNHKLYLHRILLGDPAGVLIDHKDRNGLNCQRDNLRAATKSTNMANRPKRSDSKVPYKGITWHQQSNKWRVRIAGKQVGMFVDPLDAAKAYDAAAMAKFGEYACLNFPTGEHNAI